MGRRHRVDQLLRLLDDDTLPVAGRLLAVLVLLFGQPVSKLVRLPRAAVSTEGDSLTLTLTLGDGPLPLPAPIAALLPECARNAQGPLVTANSASKVADGLVDLSCRSGSFCAPTAHGRPCGTQTARRWPMT